MNVYEFHWQINGNSQNRGTANAGFTRVLAQNYGAAWDKFLPYLEANFKNGKYLDYEVSKAIILVNDVTIL